MNNLTRGYSNSDAVEISLKQIAEPIFTTKDVKYTKFWFFFVYPSTVLRTGFVVSKIN